MRDVDEMFVERLHAVIVYYDVAGWVEEREVVEVAWKKTRALIIKGPGANGAGKSWSEVR